MRDVSFCVPVWKEIRYRHSPLLAVSPPFVPLLLKTDFP